MTDMVKSSRMHRVPISFLSVAAAAFAAGILATAPSSAAPAIACPVAGQAIIPCCGPVETPRDAIVPCCGPVETPRDAIVPCCGSVAGAQSLCCPAQAAGIEPICCPPAAQCATPLTIAASPDPATAGQQVVISGTLLDGAAGTPVVVYQQLPGQGAFTKLATTTTDASGGYTITQGSVQTDSKWYVAAGDQHSTTVAESVYAVVTLSRAGSATARRRTVVLSGRVKPAHQGQRLLLEQLRPDGWRLIARPRLDSRSGYAIVHTFANDGVMHLRAVLPADQRNLRSFSRVISLTV